MEELSRRTRSICVYAGVDLARIFSCGDIARTFRKGVWLRPFDLKFDELVKDGYPEDLLNAVRYLCIDLSESSKGGTVVLQKANALESCKPFRDVKFNPCDLFGLTKGQQKAYAEMDGAIIVTTSGKMIGISQRLVYPEWGTGSPGGARHESASRYSGQHESVVFVVSSDGPISIFKQGSLWANWFEELKP